MRQTMGSSTVPDPAPKDVDGAEAKSVAAKNRVTANDLQQDLNMKSPPGLISRPWLTVETKPESARRRGVGESSGPNQKKRSRKISIRLQRCFDLRFNVT
jgi:hypothetical protein